MVEGIVWLLKAVILTEGLTTAARSWGVFDKPRSRVKMASPFFRRLLDCFECTSVWAAAFVFLYLVYFEWDFLTYTLLFARISLYLRTVYELLDASRAVKEGQI